MQTTSRALLFALVPLGLLGTSADAADRIRVVASTTDLKALTEARGDRSMEQVHPLGNPHYPLDPGMAPAMTANILERLVRVAPQYRATFERNRQAFLGRLDEAMARWTTMMAPFKGKRVIVDHNM